MEPFKPFKHQGPLFLDSPADIGNLPQIRELIGRTCLRTWIGPDGSWTMILDPDRVVIVCCQKSIPGTRRMPLSIDVGKVLPDQDWSNLDKWEVNHFNGQVFTGFDKNVLCFGDRGAIVGYHEIAIVERVKL